MTIRRGHRGTWWLIRNFFMLLVSEWVENFFLFGYLGEKMNFEICRRVNLRLEFEVSTGFPSILWTRSVSNEFNRLTEECNFDSVDKITRNNVQEASLTTSAHVFRPRLEPLESQHPIDDAISLRFYQEKSLQFAKVDDGNCWFTRSRNISPDWGNNKKIICCMRQKNFRLTEAEVSIWWIREEFRGRKSNKFKLRKKLRCRWIFNIEKFKREFLRIFKIRKFQRIRKFLL